MGVNNSEDLQQILITENWLCGIEFEVNKVDILNKYFFSIQNSLHYWKRKIKHHFSSVVKQHTTKLPKLIRYRLRFPAELRTGLTLLETHLDNWFTNLLFPPIWPPVPRNPYINDGGIPPGYRVEGFLAIQNAINQEYIKAHSKEGPEILIQVIRYTRIYCFRLNFLISKNFNFSVFLYRHIHTFMTFI